MTPTSLRTVRPALAPHLSPPVRTGQVRLSDGRLLGWGEWGPDGAPAVLLCPGAATTRRLGFAPPALLRRLGVRLLSVDRPGLGASDAEPGRTLDRWPQDVRELRDGRGLALAGAVGFSQGAPFALACAHAGVVDAASLVSGTDELAHPALRGLLPTALGETVDAVLRDRQAAEEEMAGRGGARSLQDLVQRTSSPLDQAVYGEPAFARAFAEALQDGFRRGPRGWARDVVLTLSPWPFAAEDVAARLDLWYGVQDASPVHSPDHGLTLARRLPHARRHLLATEGGSLLWTRAEAVLRALLEP